MATGTMTSTGTMNTLEKGLDSLDYISQLLHVADELNLAEIGRELDLTTAPGRHLLKTMDTEIRLRGINEPVRETRIYLFNDLLIFAKYVKDKKDSDTGTSDTIVFGKVIGRRRESDASDDNSEETEDTEKTGQTNSLKGKLKLKMWLDLGKVKVKLLEENDHHGLQIMYVFRNKVRDKEGNSKWESVVKREEVWCKDKDTAEELHEAIVVAKNDLIIEQRKKRKADAAASESASSDGTKRAPRRRAHAKGKDTLKKMQQAKNLNSGTKTTQGTLDVGLTLADIEKRYNVDLTSKDKEAEFEVTFEEGSMGIALSSTEEIGVFVGKVSPGSMAEAGEVTLGDRVLEINGKPIPKEMHWKECLKLLHDRPLKIKFARKAVIEENVQAEKEEEEEIVEEQAKEENEKLKERRKARGGRRQWKSAVKKGKEHGMRLENLDDMKKKYANKEEFGKTQEIVESAFDKLLKKSTDKDEKQVLNVLKEIYTTERSYVNSLLELQYDYREPLEKAKANVLCKDLPGYGVKFCEHGNIALACNKESGQTESLVDGSDIDAIFMNTPNIVMVNKKLLDMLESQLRKLIDTKTVDHVTIPEYVQIYANTFVQVSPFFKLYGAYASHYVDAVAHLSNLRQSNKALGKFLEKKEGNHTSLRDLLMMPVQRLCRYPLLFQNLMKGTTPYILKENERIQADSNRSVEEMDKLNQMIVDLTRVYEEVQKIATEVNAFVGENQQLEELIRVFNELGGNKEVPDLLKPSRKYVETVMMYIRFPKEKKILPAYLYIFNDLVIVATPKNSTWKKVMNATRNGSMDERSSIRMPSVVDKTKAQASSKTAADNSRNLTMKGALVNVKLWLPIRRLKNVKSMPSEEEGKFGFSFFYATRVNPGEKHGKKKNKGDTIDTAMARYEIFCDAETERDQLLKKINDLKDELLANESEKKKVAEKIGAGQKRRKYKTKKVGNNSGHASASDRANTLRDLQKTTSSASLTA